MKNNNTALFDPSDAKADATMALRIPAAPAFGKPVVVTTTAADVQAIWRRLNTAPVEEQRSVSNRLYREGMAFRAEDVHARVGSGSDGTALEEWETFCGKVLTFYCVRKCLDGRLVPILLDQATLPTDSCVEEVNE